MFRLCHRDSRAGLGGIDTKRRCRVKSVARKNFRWTDKIDALFFEDIANGVSIRQAARNHGIPIRSGERRFQHVRASMGAQGE